VVWVVGMVRVVRVVGMVWETRASSHRIVHGSRLAWWRRIRIACSSCTAVIGRIVEGVTGGDVLADVRWRISWIIGVAIDAHVGRRRRRRSR